MNIKETIVILLVGFSFFIGHQLGLQDVSFWIILLIAFAGALLTFVLLSKDLFKKVERR